MLEIRTLTANAHGAQAWLQQTGCCQSSFIREALRLHICLSEGANMTGTLPASFLTSFQDLAILGLAFNQGMFVHNSALGCARVAELRHGACKQQSLMHGKMVSDDDKLCVHCQTALQYSNICRVSIYIISDSSNQMVCNKSLLSYFGAQHPFMQVSWGRLSMRLRQALLIYAWCSCKTPSCRMLVLLQVYTKP